MASVFKQTEMLLFHYAKVCGKSKIFYQLIAGNSIYPVLSGFMFDKSGSRSCCPPGAENEQRSDFFALFFTNSCIMFVPFKWERMPG